MTKENSFDDHAVKISCLLPGFRGANAHQSRGNLMPCKIYSTTISCNKIDTKFEGNGKSGSNTTIWKTGSGTLLQVPVFDWNFSV